MAVWRSWQWVLMCCGVLVGGCQRDAAPPAVQAVVAAEGETAAAAQAVEIPVAVPEPAPAKDTAVVAPPSDATMESVAGAPAELPATVPAAIPAEQTTTPLLPAPSVESPVVDSGRHRELFNRVAAEYYPLQWVRDVEEPHVINVLMDELDMPIPMREAFGMQGGAWEETSALRKAIDLIQSEVERRRVSALQTVLKAQAPAVITMNLAALGEDVRPVVEALVPLGHRIHERAVQQLGAGASAVRRAVYEQGDDSAIQLLQRVGVPTCGAWSNDAYCSLLPTFPHFAAAQNAVVVDDASLADQLKVIAGGDGLDAGIRQYLEAASSAFTSTDATAWTPADTAWKGARGPVEIVLGPTTFVVGVDHAPTSPLIVALPNLRQKIEAALKGVAPEHYQPRQLQAGPYVRVIDVVLAAGDAKVTPLYTVTTPRLAEQVYADDGKRVVCANLLTARLPVITALTDAIAMEGTSARVTAEAVVTNAVLEQFAFDLGPRVEAQSPLAAELRMALASAIAQWMIPLLEQDTVVTADESSALLTTHVMTLLHQARQGEHDPAYNVAQLELTHLARQGALKRDGDRVVLDATVAHAAYGVLLRELLRTAASSDDATRQAMLRGYAALLPAGMQPILRRLPSLPPPRDVVFVYQPAAL